MVSFFGRARRRRLLLILAYHYYRKTIKYQPKLKIGSLPPPNQSPWAIQKRKLDPDAYFLTTGLTIPAFNYLHERLREHSFFNRRRPRGISAYDMLGLVLYHFKTTGLQWQLQQIFGYSAARVSRNLSWGIDLLLEILETEPNAAIKWPTKDKMEEFSQIILDREPKLGSKVFGFIDGTRLKILDHPNLFDQNAFYNRKYHSNVANLFCFTPDGCICWYAINYPGSWGDSKLAVDFYDRLMDEQKTPSPYMVLADQGFTVIKNKILSTAPGMYTPEIHAAATCIRQGAEWGVGGWKKSWPRLKMPLPCNRTHNRKTILLASRLHNYKTRTTGVNQIRTVFYGQYIVSKV